MYTQTLQYCMYILALYGQTDILDIPYATHTPLYHCMDRQTHLGIVHVHVVVTSMDSTLSTSTSMVRILPCTPRHFQYYMYILALYGQTDILDISKASCTPLCHSVDSQTSLGIVHVHVTVISMDSTLCIYTSLDTPVYTQTL